MEKMNEKAMASILLVPLVLESTSGAICQYHVEQTTLDDTNVTGHQWLETTNIQRDVNRNRMMETLKKIGKMKAGWDGADAKALPDDVMRLSRKIVASLDHYMEIFPTRRQTIQIQKTADDKSYLEFEVFPKQIVMLYVPQMNYAAAIEKKIPAESYLVVRQEVNLFFEG